MSELSEEAKKYLGLIGETLESVHNNRFPDYSLDDIIDAINYEAHKSEGCDELDFAEAFLAGINWQRNRLSPEAEKNMIEFFGEDTVERLKRGYVKL